MREIKYKAWHQPTKQMFKPFSLYSYVKGNIDNIQDDDITVGNLMFPMGTIFLEFTGHVDKNKKEIYEGDILELDNLPNIKKNYEVIFEEGKFECGGMDIKSALELCGAKVIGNIYENPEITAPAEGSRNCKNCKHEEKLHKQYYDNRMQDCCAGDDCSCECENFEVLIDSGGQDDKN